MTSDPSRHPVYSGSPRAFLAQLVWFVVSFLMVPIELALAQDIAKKVQSQTWVGWLESPSEQQRWIVRLENHNDSWQGTVQTPDRDERLIKLTSIRMNADDWGFEWTHPQTGKTVSYIGKVESEGLVRGLVVQGETALFAQLKSVKELPDETKDTLGADSIWTDQPIAGSDKIPYDLRLRIYSSGPFFDGEDRLVLDSVAKQVIGLPVKIERDSDNNIAFRVPSLGVEYRAQMDTTGERMTGILTAQGKAQPVMLTRWKITNNPNKRQSTSAPSLNNVIEPKVASDSPKVSDARIPSKPNGTKNESVQIRMEQRPASNRNPNLAEAPFVLEVGNRSPRKGAPNTHQLGCTMRLPDNMSSPVPAVVIASTFGSQDRDGTVGKVKFYKQLADWLATLGIASIRFDDRGLGESSPVNPEFSLQDSVNDLSAVVNYLKTQKEVDPMRVGILGHGQGAYLATRAVLADRSLGFLILIAPPGVNGSRILLTESDRISELEGLDESSRKLFLAIQECIHKEALLAIEDEAILKRDVDDLIKRFWPDLLKTFGEQKSSEEQQVKKALQEKLLSDLAAFRSKYNREFLYADPSANWMIMDCPILALWGSLDSQVVPGINSVELKRSAERNTRNRITWMVLPEMNHLLQKCRTGHPGEYESLGSGADKAALDVIKKWLIDQGVIE